MESKDLVTLGAATVAGFIGGVAAVHFLGKGGRKPRRIVSTDLAPAAIGPYNQAIIKGHEVFVSGMIGLKPGTKEFAGTTATEQAEQCLKNLRAVLEAAGSSLARVVKVTVLLRDLDEYKNVNEVYAKYFPADTAPARAAFQVVRLPADAEVEIDAIAAL